MSVQVPSPVSLFAWLGRMAWGWPGLAVPGGWRLLFASVACAYHCCKLVPSRDR